MKKNKQEWYTESSYLLKPPFIRLSSIEVIDVEVGEGRMPYWYVVVKTVGGSTLRLGEYNTKESAEEKANNLYKELFN